MTAVNCGGQEAKAKAKAKCKVTNNVMDGLGVVGKLMGGGRRQIGRQDLFHDGG